MSSAYQQSFGKPFSADYRTSDDRGNVYEGSVIIDSIRILPPYPHRIYTAEELGGEAAMRHVATLHPDIRDRVAAALAEMHAEGIALQFGPHAAYRDANAQAGISAANTGAEPGTSFHNFGLAIDITPVNGEDRERIHAIMQRYGFANDMDETVIGGERAYATRIAEFRGWRDMDYYQTSQRWQEAYAIRELPRITIDGREYPLIPGGTLWQQYATPAQAAEVKARFGIDVPPARDSQANTLPNQPITGEELSYFTASTPATVKPAVSREV